MRARLEGFSESCRSHRAAGIMSCCSACTIRVKPLSASRPVVQLVGEPVGEGVVVADDKAPALGQVLGVLDVGSAREPHADDAIDGRQRA